MTVCCDVSTVSFDFSENTMHNDCVVRTTDVCPILFFLRRKQYINVIGSRIALFLNQSVFHPLYLCDQRIGVCAMVIEYSAKFITPWGCGLVLLFIHYVK